MRFSQWRATCSAPDVLGWMMIFALFLLTGSVLTFASPVPQSESVRLATILFGALFCLSVLTRIIRGRV